MLGSSVSLLVSFPIVYRVQSTCHLFIFISLLSLRGPPFAHLIHPQPHRALSISPTYFTQRQQQQLWPPALDVCASQASGLLYYSLHPGHSTSPLTFPLNLPAPVHRARPIYLDHLLLPLSRPVPCLQIIPSLSGKAGLLVSHPITAPCARGLSSPVSEILPLRPSDWKANGRSCRLWLDPAHTQPTLTTLASNRCKASILYSCTSHHLPLEFWKCYPIPFYMVVAVELALDRQMRMSSRLQASQ